MKEIERVISLKQVIHIATIFLSVQFLGLLLLCFSLSVFQEISSQQPSIDVWSLFLYILLTTFILLFFVKKTTKGGFIVTALDMFVVFFASSFTFEIILSQFFQNPIFISLFSYFLAIALILAKRKSQFLNNLATIISTSSVGLLIGLMLDFNSVLIFLTILAIYDFVAVFITKHMVALAKELSQKQTSFAVSSEQFIPKKKFKEVIVTASTKNPPVVVSRLQLGSGDLVAPLTFGVSSFTLRYSLLQPLFVFIFATFGLFFTVFILMKYKKPLPALPPLFLFSCIGLLISFLA
ncbi:MAG: presenilin family intramembrane aspartyl protease [Candidatus Micrarchaeia archaeon]